MPAAAATMGQGNGVWARNYVSLVYALALRFSVNNGVLFKFSPYGKDYDKSFDLHLLWACANAT